MKAIRLGDKSALVGNWQTFLRGLNYPVTVDDVFSEVTEDATIDFQARHGLTPDGIVGNGTFGKAMTLGFELVEPGGRGEASPAWPPVPAHLRLVSADECVARFGSFEYVTTPEFGPEAIRVTTRSAEFKIANVAIPQLVGVRGFPRSGEVLVHAQAAAPLKSLVAAWEAAGLLPLVKSWGGSYVPRFRRGRPGSLSNHSWGTAFDINVPWNGLGVRPPTKGQNGSVRELVPLANEHGFYWGGHFKSRPDGMHFELGQPL